MIWFWINLFQLSYLLFLFYQICQYVHLLQLWDSVEEHWWEFKLKTISSGLTFAKLSYDEITILHNITDSMRFFSYNWQYDKLYIIFVRVILVHLNSFFHGFLHWLSKYHFPFNGIHHCCFLTCFSFLFHFFIVPKIVFFWNSKRIWNLFHSLNQHLSLVKVKLIKNKRKTLTVFETDALAVSVPKFLNGFITKENRQVFLRWIVFK